MVLLLGVFWPFGCPLFGKLKHVAPWRLVAERHLRLELPVCIDVAPELTPPRKEALQGGGGGGELAMQIVDSATGTPQKIMVTNVKTCISIRGSAT